MTNTSHLVKMANQIGAFFEAMPDAEQGISGAAEHLRKFWQPRMCADLADYVARHGDGELKPVMRAALQAVTAAYPIRGISHHRD
jgi:formate dehydrogenase subunit delta